VTLAEVVSPKRDGAPAPSKGTSPGKHSENILYFARALREAGLPVGPGSVIDALAAVETARIGNRQDFYAALHCVFVKKHEHSTLFRQAFDIFWKKRGFIEKLIAMMSPMAEPKSERKQKPDAGATRVANALFKNRDSAHKPKPSVDLDARFTMSAEEVLRRKDFAQMSADEIARAQDAISRLRLPKDEVVTRRLSSDPRGARIDLRRTFRRSLRTGGAMIDLARRAPAVRHPPIVAICDISGSMSDYTRVFLHFVHALTEKRRRVHTLLFGTRLTNVTRALEAKDVDEALARCSAGVQDWSGGTRIARSLHVFNRDWSRRVLGQGAIVLLFTDGLERADAESSAIDLKREMERLQKSCRRLIWLNPLLRFDGFEAKAAGIRAMLPLVDEFRPIHSLASMADLCRALGSAPQSMTDPKDWLRRVA
jgi:uncharacterized protein with von Willebrand factor type A (vWA) domain